MTVRSWRVAAATVAVTACAACTIPTNNPTGNPDDSAPTTTVAQPSPAGTTTTDVCGESENPGGTAAPAGDLDGWRQIFVDDFDRCDLGSKWSTYSGQPGGNPNAWWDESMVEVWGGALHLNSQRTGDGWISGGVSNYPVTQQYGRWEIRMRADHSDEISYHMLLWPQRESWPPEIDFAESVSSDRTQTDAFLHWVGDDGENRKAHATIGGDFSDWHTIGVEWGPGVIRYLLDGEVWAEAHSDTMVPAQPMWLGLQAEAGACERRLDWGMTPCDESGGERPDRVDVEVDWVAVYAPQADLLREMYDGVEPDPNVYQMTESG